MVAIVGGESVDGTLYVFRDVVDLVRGRVGRLIAALPRAARAGRPPRLLLVGFVFSVHIARYVDMLRDSGWELHVFDTMDTADPHPDLDVPMTLYLAGPSKAELPADVTVVSDSEGGKGIDGRVAHLARVVEELRPDVIHSHEVAIAGPMVADARRLLGGFDAPWLATNWGSDLFWNGRLPHALPRLREVLEACDYYCAECHRDVALARGLGFRGEVLGVWPVAGGVDPELAASLRAPGPTSGRRAIALKGVGGFVGGVDAAIEAIERCAPLLRGWELCGYQMDEDKVDPIRDVAERSGMRFTAMSSVTLRESPHEAILAMHGRARVALNLNRTDGLSTSFLEALVMGALPIQGHGSCGYELTPHGRGALFVDCRDVDAVTAALERALTDDALVDGAAALNATVAREHVNRDRITTRILDGYERIASDKSMETL